MASGQERILRRRIKTVQSTKKITRAMELIAASRIVKAQIRVAAARPYAEQITEVMRNLAAGGSGLDHPLLKSREVKNVGVVVIAADRGLAGAYNSSVIRRGERQVVAAKDKGHGYSLTTAGRKAEGYFRYRGYKLDEALSGFSEQPTYEDARALAAGPIKRFEEGEVDEVYLVYTRFLSMGSQKVDAVRLLPLDVAQVAGGSSPSSKERDEKSGTRADYEFEPEPERILERLVPRYIEGRIFAALLDAAASEQAARQRAMKSATDNAEELIKRLSIVANKVRQAGITTEIMEIVGGAEALRSAKTKGKPDYFADTVVSRDVLPDILDQSGARA
ncbi:MAG: F-type H+-transporting ATPase subunit gamma [Actinomycetota bacterium]|nr:F-type H+-transporting ATPase subunit gamma [Actinomycetota bacterium]